MDMPSFDMDQLAVDNAEGHTDPITASPRVKRLGVEGRTALIGTDFPAHEVRQADGTAGPRRRVDARGRACPRGPAGQERPGSRAISATPARP